jgi:phage shock protein A
MSVWGKLFTALRGGVNEAAETVADGQAMRILDQELRDAEKSLGLARSNLAGMMATAKRIEKRILENQGKEERDIANARAALHAAWQNAWQAFAPNSAVMRQTLPICVNSRT